MTIFTPRNCSRGPARSRSAFAVSNSSTVVFITIAFIVIANSGSAASMRSSSLVGSAQMP